MQKFYKYFTWATLALIAAAASSPLVSSQGGNLPARDNYDCGTGNQVIVVENSQERIVHAAYDFTRGTVSLVQIRKGFNPPELTLQTRRLGQ